MNTDEDNDDKDQFETEETDEECDSDPVEEARKKLPVHAAPNTGKNALTVKRGPGRPRKVERMATTKDLEYHLAISEAKGRFIDKDALYKVLSGNADSAEVLRHLKIQVAREAAALEFQRIENEKFGKDTSQNSSRRIDALIKIAHLEVETRKLGGDTLDLKGEKFQLVFKMLIDTFQSIASEVLPPEQADLLFNRLGTAFEGWEDRIAVEIASRDRK